MEKEILTDEMIEDIKIRSAYKCEVCGEEEDEDRQLVVHHIDGDTSDNRPERLLAVCQECYSTINYSF